MRELCGIFRWSNDQKRRKWLKELVDLERFELSTSSMPWKRAPNCATGPDKQVFS